MSSDQNFETYLLISSKEFLIFSKDKTNNKKLFEKKLIFEEIENEKYFHTLDKFLEENIYKIEKILKNFINKIIVIVDKKNDLIVRTSYKKKNYNNFLSNDDLHHLLRDSKNQIRENYSDWLIAHMMITKYMINNEFYNHLPTNVKSEYICLDINFICFSKDFIKEIESIFNKYHIQVKKFLCGKYIRNSFEEDQTNIFSMCEKIIDGHNENEIFSVPKFQKNKGFFEKFFNFFN